MDEYSIYLYWEITMNIIQVHIVNQMTYWNADANKQEEREKHDLKHCQDQIQKHN